MVPASHEMPPPRSAADLLTLLRCPVCKSSLEAQENGYACTSSSCGRRFPEVRGVVRFVDEGNYADSFGYQWQRFQRTQLDHAARNLSETDFARKTGLKPEDLKGKLVLDVGCGMGRFAEVVTRWGARVVGIDLSAAAEVAAKNLHDREFVAFQADVFALPFAPEAFDCIYSMGVLHHTPDCEKAFKALPQYLKPGRTIAVWLYSGYNKWYRFSDFWRRYTHKMKPETLHSVLRVAVPVFYHLERGLRQLPWVGRPAAGAVHLIFPVNQQQDPEARMLDTFDWYSPKYQSKHTYEQVFRWYEAMGMEDMRVGECSIAVRGRKPARRS
jgi:SAM-dependent methyltransferase